jgi:hypothetical protein
MMPPHEPPRNLPDQIIRDSLRNAANLREFLHAAVPELADGFRRLLLRKFKQLPDVVLQRIESCTDVEQLKTAIEHVLDWNSVDEFSL